MKILQAVALATAFSAVSVIAAPNNVGCGLGSMVWDGQSGTVPQILAVTTNGTFGNQTLGITFGTLGCSKNGVVSMPVSHKMVQFTNDNLDKLAHDMAVGTGETLNALASLMEISELDKATFFNATKTNFGNIFANENVTTEEVLVSLNNVLAADPELKQYSYS